MVADAVRLIEAIPAVYYTYGSRGEILSETDALGQATTHTYDLLGRQRSVTDPDGNTTYYRYDAAGRLTELQDPVGNVTRFTYNARGQILTERQVFSDGATALTTFQYDAFGNVTRAEDRNGQVGALKGIVAYTGASGRNWRAWKTGQVSKFGFCSADEGREPSPIRAWT